MQLGILVRETYRGNKRKSSKKKVSQTVKLNETTTTKLHGSLWLGEPTATFWSPASIGSSTKPTIIWLDQYIPATSSIETGPDTWHQYSSVLSSKPVFILNINKRKTCLHLVATIYWLEWDISDTEEYIGIKGCFQASMVTYFLILRSLELEFW